MTVALSLRDAHWLLGTAGLAVEGDPLAHPQLARLARAIRRAERALRPGRWRPVSFGGGGLGQGQLRWWPTVGRSHTCAAEVHDTNAGIGWACWHPDGTHRIASGPETGAEGRRCADRALRAYIRRQGGTWEPQ